MSWNRYVSCVTMPIASPSDPSVTFRTSRPSIRTAPLVHVVQPRHEVRDRRLAGAARADQRGELSRQDVHRDVVQRPLADLAIGSRAAGRAPPRPSSGSDLGHVGRLLVPEPHVVELDLAPDVRELLRVGRVGDLVLQVEVLEDPVEQRERRLHVGGDLEHRADREEEPRLQRGERDQRARAVIVLGLGLFELCQPATRYTSAGVIEKKIPTIAKNDRPIIVWRICRPGEALVLLLEPTDLEVLPAERLGQQDAAHAEGLLGDRA